MVSQHEERAKLRQQEIMVGWGGRKNGKSVCARSMVKKLTTCGSISVESASGACKSGTYLGGTPR